LGNVGKDGGGLLHNGGVAQRLGNTLKPIFSSF
jgi:hypothetical protein